MSKFEQPHQLVRDIMVDLGLNYREPLPVKVDGSHPLVVTTVDEPVAGVVKRLRSVGGANLFVQTGSGLVLLAAVSAEAVNAVEYDELLVGNVFNETGNLLPTFGPYLISSCELYGQSQISE